ncbi:MAG TPA: hypothetical protein DCF33_22645 [Saprospirales bacterium]|nr:hypothetical protein [Saprospirales bacterium]
MNLLTWLYPFGRETTEEGRFTILRAEAIMKTIDQLELRIAERFPESGLLGVCQEFKLVAVRSEELARKLEGPIWPVRLAAVIASTLLIGLVSWALGQLLRNFKLDASGILHLLQTTESAINELIFLGLAIFFLVNLEARLKRRSALKALHRLRSIAHVIDMHQLTKDPAFHLSGNKISETQHSPKRNLTRHQLMRYLDYCSELLALNSKIAALFAQNTDDREILNTVNDLEQLVQGLSAKVWQKIMILDYSTE